MAAGLKKDNVYLQTTQLDNGFQKFIGTMAATRATDDDVIDISVTSTIFPNGNQRASIQASNYGLSASGLNVLCNTTNIDMIRLVRHIKTDSLIEVIAGKLPPGRFTTRPPPMSA